MQFSEKGPKKKGKKKGKIFENLGKNVQNLKTFWKRASDKLSTSADSEFCEWVQVGIDVYIPHRKYQVKPHSSTWFSAACAATIVHRNLFFRLYQQDKFSESKVQSS